MTPAADKTKEAKEAPAATSRIAVTHEGSIARITLQNPPLNVIDLAMMDELSQALTDLEARPETSVVILSGSDKAFSAGVDVGAHAPDMIDDMLSKFHGAILKLVGLRKVTIAAVRGHCLGGGAELAMVCDMVYTSEAATWGFPEIKLGCYPPVAATALAALIGQKQAADLILTGRSITGQQAAEMGLANRAVPDDELDTALNETLDHLTKLSSAALAITKKAMYAWDSIHFDKGLARAEKVYVEDLMKTEDAQEGIKAFMEKREPKWKGQ
jgi:cyclohexa-1,5-dienecarbonyl-CoA hydratase